jgi:HEAT repeat protein
MHPIRPILLIRLMLAATLAFSCATTSFAQSPQPTSAEQEKKLIAVLNSNAPEKEKADACRELARVGTEDAVAPLAALLPNEKLSHMARYGLETIPSPAVDTALREAAGKLRGRQLVGVIGSIGVRRDTKAVEVLTKLLRDSDNDVAQAAARALGSIGNQAAAKALLEALPSVSPANQLAFCEGLLRCAETAAAKENRKEAQAIYDRLRELSAPHQVRTAALRGAILTRQEAGLPLLGQALHSDDYTLALAAARTAQEMPESGVTRLLAGELAGLPADRQILVIQAIAERGDAAALPALFTAARSGERAVRLEAIRALAEIGNPSALPVLIDLLGDADHEIAQAAQESLASLPGKEVDAAIMTMLADGAGVHRITAMDLIVRRRMTSAVPALLDAAGSSDSRMRIAAVQKLGELAGPAELPALLDLLAKAKSPEDLDATEQALSAVCLKATKPDACVSQVETRLAESQPAQKCALVRVLGAVGGTSALQCVRSAVNDPNVEVHAAAIRVLGGWSTADAATDLLELAKAASNPTDKMICLRGYLALAGHADLPTDQRLAMCRQAASLVQKDDEKKLLMAALGSISSVEALDLIKPYLDDPATKEEASTGVVDISDKLLQGSDAAKVAPKLIDPLDKAAQATRSAELTKRAKGLLEQAKSKEGAK